MDETHTSPALAHVLELLRAGSHVELRAWDPVNEPMIRHWCDVLGIRNDRYVCDAAAQDGMGVATAPVTMLYSWVMPDFTGRYPGGHGRDLLREASISLASDGYGNVLAVRLEHRYKRSVACGERLIRRSSIESVSGRKRTWLGEGYFITEAIDFANEFGEPVADARMTLLCYRPSPRESVVKPRRPDISAVTSGAAWPVVQLEITARLIAAIAIATRDYEDVHLDADAARAAGSKDIFLNILGTAGLIQRCVEEWLGTDIHITGLELHLLAPVYPGDRLSFSLACVETGADGLLNLKVTGALSRGLHVEALVTARMPSGRTPV